ncbi:MAG: FtsX-like permease family protein [Vicinamibacterales bacterium]
MEVPFELHIALRYLLAKRKQAFISVISLISTIGVAVGVMALVIALALMTGLQQEVRDRILGSNAHIYVWKIGGFDDAAAETARLREMPDVVGAAPVVLGKALISSPAGEGFITIKGIDPILEPQVTDVASAMRTGSLEGLTPGEGERDGILLGFNLAEQLGVQVGDTVQVLTPQGTLSPMGMMPRTRVLRVAGIYTLGLFEFDAQWGFVSLDVAMRLLDKTHVDYVQLRVRDMYEAPRIAASIPPQLGPDYGTEDWAQMNQSLFSALWIERVAIALTIGLIVVVGALNIVASLILLVMEKHRDIGILKTMGAGARSISTLFILQGLIIGLVGTAVGATLGFTVSYLANYYRLIRVPIDVYQVSYVPFAVRPLDMVIVIVAAIFICFIATIYPSRQASRLDPAQALRYE